MFRKRSFHNGIPTLLSLGCANQIWAPSRKSSEVRCSMHDRMATPSDSLSVDNDIDGPTLLKLSESMVVRLFPTIKLEVQFLDLLQLLKQRHTVELSSKKTFPSSSNGHGNHRSSAVAHKLAAHVTASSSFDNGNGYSSNSNSPTALVNGHHQPKATFSERSQIPQRLAPKGGLPMKTLKREPKYFPAAAVK